MSKITRTTSLPANKPAAPKSTKDKVNFTSQSRLDARNPIPFEYGGTSFSYVTGTRYIPFLHGDDDFAKRLLEASILSNTQQACIGTKVDFCAGRGIQDKNGKEFSPEFTAFLQRTNARNQTATTINRKALGSHFTFGNTPIEITRLTVAGKKFVYVYVHNFLEWRLGWPGKDGIVRTALQSKLFLKQGVITAEQLKNSRVLPIYDPSKPSSKKNWLQDVGGVERTLIWLKNETTGYEEYGMPQSIGSLIFQILEYKGARYNLDNFENNMVLGGIISLKGNLSQIEADKIGRQILNSHTGDGKRGRFAVLSSEDGIEGSDYHEYDTSRDGSYQELDDKAQAKIITANQWHSMLAGLDLGTGALGKGNSFLRQIYEIKKRTVIDPMQEFLLENLWQPLQTILQDWTGIDATEYELEIADIDPISALADIDPTEAVQINEVRSAIGLEPDPTKEGKYMGEKPVEPKIKTDVPT